jgi:thiamine transporter ThiT
MLMIADAGKKLMARIAPLFTQFRLNDIVDTCWIAIVPNLVFALSLTFVVLSFASVYSVHYVVWAAAAVVKIPLVLLGLSFRRGVASGPTAGTVEG